VAAGVIIAVLVVVGAVVGFFVYKKRKEQKAAGGSAAAANKSKQEPAAAPPAKQADHREVSVEIKDTPSPAPITPAPSTPASSQPRASVRPVMPQPGKKSASTYTPHQAALVPPLTKSGSSSNIAQTNNGNNSHDMHDNTHANRDNIYPPQQQSTDAEYDYNNTSYDYTPQSTTPAPPMVYVTQIPIQSKRTDGSTLVFGLPLTKVVTEDCLIPHVVQDSIEYLLAHGLKEEGILRLAGSSSEVAKYKAAYDRGERVDFSTCSDINSVADVLKRYLRELPEPLVPAQTSSAIEKALQMEDEHSRITTVREFIHNGVQEAHVHTLQALVLFLARVVEHSSVNKMGSTNLALVFSPTLKLMPDILNTFIKYAESIFA
jgi:hypothetical protein